jgi:ABC-type uncharacterized transport system ATPase subunit
VFGHHKNLWQCCGERQHRPYLRYGEILALLGENGSGKTTLMNILSGIYRPDAGTVRINGDEVGINSPMDAMRLKSA